MYFQSSNHYDKLNSIEENDIGRELVKKTQKEKKHECIICLQIKMKHEFTIKLKNALLRHSINQAIHSNHQNTFLDNESDNDKELNNLLQKNCNCNCYLHQLCLDKWLKTRLECPICRMKLYDDETIHENNHEEDVNEDMLETPHVSYFVFFNQSRIFSFFSVFIVKTAFFLKKFFYYLIRFIFINCIFSSILYLVYLSLVTYQFLTREKENIQ